MQLVDDGAATAVWVGRALDVVLRQRGAGSGSYVSSRSGSAQPRSTHASFHPRSNPPENVEVHLPFPAWCDPVRRRHRRGRSSPRAEPSSDLARRVEGSRRVSMRTSTSAPTPTRIMAARVSASWCVASVIASAAGAYTQRSSTPAGRNAPSRRRSSPNTARNAALRAAAATAGTRPAGPRGLRHLPPAGRCRAACELRCERRLRRSRTAREPTA